MDPEYACGMDAYDEACQELAGEIWDDYYLAQNGANDGKVIALPEISVPKKCSV